MNGISKWTVTLNIKYGSSNYLMSAFKFNQRHIKFVSLALKLSYRLFHPPIQSLQNLLVLFLKYKFRMIYLKYYRHIIWLYSIFIIGMNWRLNTVAWLFRKVWRFVRAVDRSVAPCDASIYILFILLICKCATILQLQVIMSYNALKCLDKHGAAMNRMTHKRCLFILK